MCKKSLNFLILILLIGLTFVGCDFKQQKEENNIASEVEFAYNLVDYDKTIKYDGSPISITFELYNKADAAEFGIMIYIGGCNQKFRTSEYADMQYIHKYSLQKKQQKSIVIEFTPQNVEIGEYELFVVSILNPSFTAEAPNYVFGYNHKITYASTKINISQKLQTNIEIYKDAQSFPITQGEINSYRNEDGSNQLDNYMDCVILNNGATEDRRIILNGNDLNIDFKLLGGDAAAYYLTIYINHKPVKINDNYDHALIYKEKAKSSTITFNYDIDNLDDNSVIYAIAIPVDRSTDDIYPIKSDSIVIVK